MNRTRIINPEANHGLGLFTFVAELLKMMIASSKSGMVPYSHSHFIAKLGFNTDTPTSIARPIMAVEIHRSQSWPRCASSEMVTFGTRPWIIYYGKWITELAESVVTLPDSRENV